MFLEDILLAMDKIQKYTNNMSQEEFKDKDIVIDAVTLKLSVRQQRVFQKKLKKEYPKIPWKRMIGLRNIVIHEYFGIDLSIVWTIVKNNFPEARKDIEEMVSKIKMSRD